LIDMSSGALPPWLRIVFIVTIALGAVFRFTYLDSKVYTHDETLTSLRTSGFLLAEFEQDVAKSIVSVAELKKYQTKNAEHGAGSTIHALAVDDPQHPPIYYVLERSWATFFHNSIGGRRALGALFGALTIPALYWLCRELLPGNRIWALTSATFFAVSPFELQYTQQAREYTLWGLCVVISSALFIRAIRTDDGRAWLAYAVSVAVGLYSYLFFYFVALAHAITLASARSRRSTRALRFFGGAIVAASLLYSPWLANLAIHRETVAETNSYFSAPLPAIVYIYKWLFNVGAVFFDAEYVNIWYSFLLIPITAIAALAFFVTARTKDHLVAAFVLTLFFTATLPLLVPDLLLHQSRAISARYLLPAWIAVDLAVAYWITLWLTDTKIRRRIVTITAPTLIVLSLASWIVSARSVSWWTVSYDVPIVSIAAAINETPKAVVLTDDAVMALQLSNYLDAGVRFDFRGVASPSFLRLDRTTSRFMIDPSPNEFAAIARERNVRLQLVYAPPYTDSPMLHGVSALAPLRSKLSSVRAGKADSGVGFRLWSVTNVESAKP
jgi:uncharacterized membrane protein